MTGFLSTLPWGWYAAGLCLCVALLALANYYEDRQLPRAREALDREPWLIGSELDTYEEDAA